MFEWNEEDQLRSTIWYDGAGESEDHIVPYPIQNEEKFQLLFLDPVKINQETSNVTLLDKKPLPISSKHGVECVRRTESLSGFNLDFWYDGLEKSATDSVEADHDDTSTIVSNSAIESLKVVSLREETGQYDFEVFQNLPEDEEQDHSVNDEWATIGSFDDLDRIFSDCNPIFEDVSGITDDPWPYSNNASRRPSRLTSTTGESLNLPLALLKSASEEFDIKAPNMLESIHSFRPVSEKLNKIRSLPQNLQMHEKRQTFHNHHDGSNGAKQHELPEKGNKQKLPLKGHQFQQVQFQSTNKNRSDTLLDFSFNENAPYQHPDASILSKFYPVEGNHKLGTASLPGKSIESSMKPPEMSPMEKIEKLRRRQQLRAILAIQKQRQQFSHQVPVIETSTMESMNGKVDGNNNFSVLDHGSQIDHGDSKTVSIHPYNFSREESVLNQLQNAISKLDVQTRLCIRNSLFRLARSSIKRQCLGDSSSEIMNWRDGNISNTDIHNHERFTEVIGLETDTNPVDRIVANLVFRTPMQFLGELSKAPNLHFSSDHSCGREKPARSLVKEYFPKRFENSKSNTLPRESTSPLGYFEKNWSNNRPCSNAVGNASIHEVTNEPVNVEISKS